MTAKRTAYPDECPAFEVIGKVHGWHAFKIGTHVTGDPCEHTDALDCYGGENADDRNSAWHVGQYIAPADLRPLTPAAVAMLAIVRRGL